MKKRVIYGIIIAAFIVAAAILLKVFGPPSTQHKITLPSPASESGNGFHINSDSLAEVTPETVQAVLKTISRAESYHHTYSIKSFWAGGSSEATYALWQKGANTRLSISRNDMIKNLLIVDGLVSVWYNDSSSVFTSSLSDYDFRDADKFSSLISYEEILSCPIEDILSADYVDKLEEPCIYAKYKSGGSNYVNHIYVSVDTGLLMAAEIYDGETLIYSMSALSTELSTPADDIFVAPSTKKA
ncbi:MAG: hypothetical protein RSC86_00715 [Oscillospiraceae bacterium]